MSSNSERMSVLFMVDFAVGRSGPHRNVVGTLNSLSNRPGIRIVLLTNEIDHNERYYNSANIEIIKGFRPHSILNIWKNCYLVLKARKKCDLIYIPTGMKSFIYAWAFKGAKTLVGGPNVTGIPLIMKTWAPNRIMTMYMADAWINMSEFDTSLLVKEGTPRSYINLIPHSIDTTLFSPLKKNSAIWDKYVIRKEAFKILHVGRMNAERKGIKQLVEALKIINEHGIDAELIIVGTDGNFFDEYRNEKRIHYIGKHFGEALATLYASADLFIACSRVETFWFTPLEAMASGLPVVVSIAGATPEMIPEDGVQGKIVDVTDGNFQKFTVDAADRIAQAAILLIKDSELRARIALQGRKYVAEKFSERALAEKIITVFKENLEKNE